MMIDTPNKMMAGERTAGGAQARAALTVTGMTCAACVGRLEKVLSRQKGVSAATVSLTAERADITFDPDQCDLPRLIEAIEGAGFGATPLVTGQSADTAVGQETETTLRVLRIAALLTLPLVLDMGLALAGSPWRVPGWVQLALATPVQFWAGARFYRGAWYVLKGGGANMDVLVALGTSAAYALSAWLVLSGGGGHGHEQGHTYFEAAALVITLVIAGKFLEARARRATNRAVEALMALRPATARRIGADGGETEVAVERLVRGDVVRVRPGERVPADGVITRGRAAIDESMLTGEPMARERDVGAKVVGGTVDLDGLLLITVTAVGEEATLGRMVALVGQAQASKPRIQRLADQVSGYFAFFVAAVALITFAGWMAVSGALEASVLPAVAVLVVACPCALGLATPAVIAVALGAGARAGILIRDAEALETAHAVTAVVFDKTGTLTEDRPRLVRVIAADGDDADALAARAAALQRASAHPIARALSDYARGRQLILGEVGAFRAIAGRGVWGEVDGRGLAIGNRSLMAELGADTAAWEAQAGAEEAEARAVVWIAQTEGIPTEGTESLTSARVVGLVALADQPRAGSAAAVAALAARKIESVMLTGDARGAARAVAARLGIGRFVAEARPEDKIAEIERLQAAGLVVAMVGDGVNDAPALAKANLGVAMGGGTDVAMQAASVGLVRDDPRLVVALLDLARATRAKIVQNLVWAFGFNLVMIPLAAFGVLTPVPAAIAMTASSLGVVGNALSLRRWSADLGSVDDSGDSGVSG